MWKKELFCEMLLTSIIPINIVVLPQAVSLELLASV